MTTLTVFLLGLILGWAFPSQIKTVILVLALPIMAVCLVGWLAFLAILVGVAWLGDLFFKIPSLIRRVR